MRVCVPETVTAFHFLKELPHPVLRTNLIGIVPVTTTPKTLIFSLGTSFGTKKKNKSRSRTRTPINPRRKHNPKRARGSSRASSSATAVVERGAKSAAAAAAASSATAAESSYDNPISSYDAPLTIEKSYTAPVSAFIRTSSQDE